MDTAPDGIALFGLDNKRVRHEIKKATKSRPTRFI